MAEPSVYGDIKGKRKRNSYRPDSSFRAAQTLGVKLVMRLNVVLNAEAFKKPLALAILSQASERRKVLQQPQTEMVAKAIVVRFLNFLTSVVLKPSLL